MGFQILLDEIIEMIQPRVDCSISPCADSHWYSIDSGGPLSIWMGPDALDEVWPLAEDTNINHATSNNNAFQNRALAAVSTDGMNH